MVNSSSYSNTCLLLIYISRILFHILSISLFLSFVDVFLFNAT